jgi:type IV pilus assembly protein PilW
MPLKMKKIKYVNSISINWSLRRPSYVSSQQAEKGFTIIEIMVGMAIGLLTLLAIYQLFATSEGRRRTVAAVSQSQSAGAMALFSIERDIRSAGLGFASLDTTYLGCTVEATNSARSPAVFQFPLLPVEIKDGRELRVLTGSSNNMFTGARYAGSENGEFKMLKSNAGFQPGDVAIGTNDNNTSQCLMMEVTRGAGSVVTLPGGGSEAYANVEHRDASYTSFYTSQVVQATRNGVNNNILDAGASSLGEGMLFSLGEKPTLTVWSLQDGQLTRYNYLNETETARVSVAQDVLQMVAEYGYDKDSSGKIDQSDEWTATTPTAPELGKLIAVRVAVLVRTSQFEKEEVTTANPRWANGSKEFPLTTQGNADTNWKHYRYRVYESVIPLRNTIWGQLP